MRGRQRRVAIVFATKLTERGQLNQQRPRVPNDAPPRHNRLRPLHWLLSVRLTLTTSATQPSHLTWHPPSAYKIHDNMGPFVLAAGAYLGISAGLLWTAQGSLMLAYPTEDQKGIFIGIFWSIFNLGGVVGAAVSFGNNFDNTVRFPQSCASPDRLSDRST